MTPTTLSARPKAFQLIHIKVKVCCISSVEEARTAIEAGADAVGLVSSMPSGPGIISEDLIRAIARTVPPPVATFLLTCHQRVDEIVAQQQRCGTNTVQLCDRIVEGSHTELRTAMPGVSIVQVIHVNGRESVHEAVDIAPNVDALLLDSGNQKLAAKELHRPGRTMGRGSLQRCSLGGSSGPIHATGVYAPIVGMAVNR